MPGQTEKFRRHVFPENALVAKIYASIWKWGKPIIVMPDLLPFLSASFPLFLPRFGNNSDFSVRMYVHTYVYAVFVRMFLPSKRGSFSQTRCRSRCYPPTKSLLSETNLSFYPQRNVFSPCIWTEFLIWIRSDRKLLFNNGRLRKAWCVEYYNYFLLRINSM